MKSEFFKNKTQLIASGLFVLVFGTAILLNTSVGRNILGIELNPLSSEAGLGKFRKNAKPVKGSYIVVLKDSVSNVDAKASELNGKHLGQLKHTYKSALKGFSAQMSEIDAMAMAENSDVEYVEEDGLVEANLVQTNPKWALDRIDQRSIILDNSYTYNATGQGVSVYILDSGILTTHEEINGRAFDGFDAAGGTKIGINQCHGHGTGVAGVVGSTTFGVAKNVRLYDVRVLGCTGGGTVSDVIAGVDWVTRHAIRPAVANMSIGSVVSSSMNTAVNQSINSGITYVVAAGNESDDACRHSPSSVKNAITVGATGANGGGTLDDQIYYSNHGTCVDTHAPGLSVATIWNTSNTQVASMSGTSFASPLAAGVAALYLERNPTASPAEVSNAIQQSGTAGVVQNLGPGSPNILLHSLVADGGTTPPPPSNDTTAPTVNLTSPANNATVPKKGNLKVAASASDSSGIATIVLSLDGSPIKTCNGTTSCSANVSAGTILTGTHTITATVTDKALNVNSKSVNVTK